MSTALGIYVHWPYCRRICPYCDFNVRRWRNQDIKCLSDAYRVDLAREAAWRDADQWRLETLHFGGGTPSMMPPETVKAIIAEARAHFACAPDLEIALEANPEDYAHFAALAEAGVTRLTLGIQALDPRRLKVLGRQHSPDDALRALAIARPLFASLAVDLITATPQQSLEDWCSELDRVLALPIDHLSLYGLTIEAGTAFGKRPPKGMPTSDLDAALMHESITRTTRAGFTHYEVSNYARPNHRSRYNLGVWQSLDYIGIGPGAHGRHHQAQQRYGLRKLPDPQAWQQAVLSNPQGSLKDTLESFELLDAQAAFQEWLLMGLRLIEGVPLDQLPEFLSSTITPQLLHDTLQSSSEFRDMQEQSVFRLTPQRLEPGKNTPLTLDYWSARLYEILTPIIAPDPA